MKIAVTIDRVVVEGLSLSPREQRTLHATLVRELGRALAADREALRGLRAQSLARTRASDLTLLHGADGRAIGGALAASVHGALSASAGDGTGEGGRS